MYESAAKHGSYFLVLVSGPEMGTRSCAQGGSLSYVSVIRLAGNVKVHLHCTYSSYSTQKLHNVNCSSKTA